MKREWVIVAGVLVPFAVLVAAGFSFSLEPAPPLPVVPVSQSPLPVGPLGEAEGRIEPVVPRPEKPTLPPELEAPLKAVLPEVRQCFRDQKLKAARSVKVRFTPTRDGGFEKVEVDEQNPYLAACLEDVFAEVAWRPDGRQTFEPAAHTFSFDPSPD